MDEIPSRLLLGAHPAATWASAGLRSADLRGPLVRRAHRGRYAWVATDRSHPQQRALAAASLLPPTDGAVGGWSAAQLLGVRWLDGSTASGRPLPPMICLPPGLRVRRPGVTVLRSALAPGDVVRCDGTGARVTSPVRTAFDLARTADDVTEAVVRMDAMARHGVEPDQVAQYAAVRPGWSGVHRVRQAASLASGRTRSPGESRWRMLWVLAAGMPPPLVNAMCYDVRGRRLAEVDLLDPVLPLVGEYDGAPHSDARARASDAVRQELLQAQGLVVVRATSVDLTTHRARTVRRIRNAAASAAAKGPRTGSVQAAPMPTNPLSRCAGWSPPPGHAGASGPN